MKSKLDLNVLKKIIIVCPLNHTDEKFNGIYQLFFEEVLSVRKEINNSDNNKSMDPWKELTAFYFYNLIRKYAKYSIDPGEATEILENCIVKRYISHKNVKFKIEKIANDEQLTAKFTSDLYYTTRDFLRLKSERENNVPISKQDQTGEWIQSIEISTDREVKHTIERIDYGNNDDLLEIISGMVIKSVPFQNYIMCRFKQLESMRLIFRNEVIDLPMNFNLNNNIIARYYLWRKKI